MTRPTRVYIAGPISSDPLMGTRNAVLAGSALLEHGYAPFIPHLSSYWHMISPHDYETWMKLDFAWIPTCDAMLRLPGESKGSDREVALAKALRIPVYYSLSALIAGASSHSDIEADEDYPATDSIIEPA